MECMHSYRYVQTILLGYKHKYLQSDWLNYVKTRMLSQYNQEYAQLSPEPFPRERVGSGDKTNSSPANSRGGTKSLIFPVTFCNPNARHCGHALSLC